MTILVWIPAFAGMTEKVPPEFIPAYAETEGDKKGCFYFHCTGSAGRSSKENARVVAAGCEGMIGPRLMPMSWTS